MTTNMSRPGATLVINLTRFGDLLQSQPLVEDLHRQGQRVHLICLDNFSSALPLLRHVERAWPLPGAKLMALLDGDWRRAAALLLDFAHTVREEVRPRRVINLTSTLPARLLAGLLAAQQTDGAAEIQGFSLDAEGFGRNKGIWATFLNGTTANRLSAPFNLVDMFRMIGASPTSAAPSDPPVLQLEKPSATALAAADALLADAPAETRGFVCMQLGASETRRQWPAQYFAAVGDRLWREQRLCAVLLGAPAEAALGDEYARAAREPFVNAVGKTDLPQLAALLCRSRLLVTNDTGTMHLAAGLGVISLAIFLATAQPCDTGPYLPGCCCLEPALPCHPCPYNRPCPNNLACVTLISPQSVGDLALAWLNAGTWESAPISAIEKEARVWRTEQDAQGFAAVRCLSAQQYDDRSLWLTRQRIFWRQILDDLELSENPQTQPPASAAQALEQIAFSTAFKQRMAEALDQASRLFSTLTEQGNLVGKSPKAGQLFLRNCERLQGILDACPELRSLGGFWRALRQERGDNMPALLSITGRLAGHLSAWRDKFKNGTLFA